MEDHSTLEALGTEALGGDALDRAALIAAVRERNPSLEATRRAWEAARARVPQAGSLPDPMAAYSVAPLSVTGDEPCGHVVEIGQELPWPGTLGHRRAEAEADADAAGERHDAAALDLELAASLLFDDYYLVGRAIAINDEHVRLLDELQRVATARYAAGLAPQQAPLQAESELAHLVHRRVELASERDVVAARLNALLHRPPRAPLPPPPAALPAAAAHSLASLAPEPEELIRTALERRPEVAAAADEVAAREAALELARLERRPGLRPMASYNSMWGSEAHRWMVGVGLSLPVRRERIAAAVAEAEAELEAARAWREHVEVEVAAEVEIADHRLDESHHVLDLFRDRLLPSARDQVRAARAGFETGQVDFPAVIEAERNLRRVELGFEEAVTNHHRRLAELRRAAGAPAGGGETGTPTAQRRDR